jgi:phenylacetate-CoA ligase
MEHEELRQRHLARLPDLMRDHLERLRWPAERLRLERRDRLRDLLRVAKTSSPWHRERLHGIDPDSFEERDLEAIPPMTKDDLMANWDAVVSDPRLDLDLAERHIAGLTSDAYLLDEFHAVASGGSTGRRGCSSSDGRRGRSPTPGSCARRCGTGWSPRSWPSGRTPSG